MFARAIIIVLLIVCFSGIEPSNCIAFQSRDDADANLAGDFLRLLRNKQMLEDMVLVGHQRDAIKQAQEALQVQIADMLRQPQRELGAIEKARKETLRKIFDEILLPMQQKRFLELVNRSKLSSVGGSYSQFLIANNVALFKTKRAIQLNKDQIERLKKIGEQTAEKLNEESKKYAERIARILEDEKKAVGPVLDMDQRSVFNDLFGAKVIGKKTAESVAPNVLQRYLWSRKKER